MRTLCALLLISTVVLDVNAKKYHERHGRKEQLKSAQADESKYNLLFLIITS